MRKSDGERAAAGNRSPRAASGHAGDLFIVRIETTKAFAPLVDAGLERLGMDSVAWYVDKRGGVRFEFYDTSRAKARQRMATLRRALQSWADDEPWSVAVLHVSPKDWSEYWKRFFRTTRVSGRIVIKPSWEAYRPKPRDVVIEIDPGMAFGTGQHFSTASCLRLMEGLAGEWLRADERRAYSRPSAASGRFVMPALQTRSDCRAGFIRGPSGPRISPPVYPRTVLDLGCGSGILSIAAAKLGFGKVLAIDNDPAAVEIARQNVGRNGASACVEARVMELAKLRLRRTFDAVVANMYSGILEKFASTIARTVRRDPPGCLILAGILTSQYARILRTYRGLGFREIRRLSDGEWTSGCLRRMGRKRRNHGFHGWRG
jgi:ribosomal protein L11 methyltransferase